MSGDHRACLRDVWRRTVVERGSVAANMNSCPVQPVEVRAITYRRLGLRRHCGHLEYRLLPDAWHLVGTFWLEYAKGDGLGSLGLPLARARTRERLMEKLHAEAAALGHVVSFVEVHYA